jgi:hypothetical protein
MYYHGRAGSQDLRDDVVIQWSESLDTAKQYAGKNGSIWKLGNTQGFLNANEAINLVRKELDSGSRPKWFDEFSQEKYETDPEGVLEEINPKNIVDSAGWWDDPAFVFWFIDTFDMQDKGVILHDGVVTFSPEAGSPVKLNADIEEQTTKFLKILENAASKIEEDAWAKEVGSVRSELGEIDEIYKDFEHIYSRLDGNVDIIIGEEIFKLIKMVDKAFGMVMKAEEGFRAITKSPKPPSRTPIKHSVPTLDPKKELERLSADIAKLSVRVRNVGQASDEFENVAVSEVAETFEKASEQLRKTFVRLEKLIPEDVQNEGSTLSEMAPPLDQMKSAVWYHGTPKESNANAIWDEGIKPDLKKGRSIATPIAGRTYATSNLHYAIIYALGGDFAGSNVPEEFWKDNRYGYVFMISGSQLTDVQPDEDQVGEAVHNDVFPWLSRFHGTLSKKPYKPKQFSSLLDAVKFGEYTAWIKAGKLILPSLSDEEKNLIATKMGNVANLGVLHPFEMWKIDKSRAAELKKDGSNFFDIAEKVKSRDAQESKSFIHSFIKENFDSEWGKTLEDFGLEEAINIKPIKWSYPSEKELDDEFHEADIDALLLPDGYPKPEERKEAFEFFKDNLAQQTIDPKDLSKENDWRFRFDDYDSFRKRVKSYGGPKDPDSMIRKIQSGGTLPMPVVIKKQDGSLLLAGGATRTAIANLSGQKIEALIFDSKKAFSRKLEQKKKYIQSAIARYDISKELADAVEKVSKEVDGDELAMEHLLDEAGFEESLYREILTIAWSKIRDLERKIAGDKK